MRGEGREDFRSTTDKHRHWKRRVEENKGLCRKEAQTAVVRSHQREGIDQKKRVSTWKKTTTRGRGEAPPAMSFRRKATRSHGEKSLGPFSQRKETQTEER